MGEFECIYQESPSSHIVYFLYFIAILDMFSISSFKKVRFPTLAKFQGMSLALKWNKFTGGDSFSLLWVTAEKTLMVKSAYAKLVNLAFQALKLHSIPDVSEVIG